ncbi:hypothetical protein CBR_g40623 [Chara braunii]|uniref:Endonuclease/exonuclease/phosphatase domain-containing protein n=1 Tax=Chara braunii TaxID=69332 RepID=A0A388LUA1_CHABU|nr:hypothetical protein CBR_g40623 [Chara braunii]|eukprot:GBG85813.1 hypothetical protein CBR_g40623 [Chara braunii]
MGGVEGVGEALEGAGVREGEEGDTKSVRGWSVWCGVPPQEGGGVARSVVGGAPSVGVAGGGIVPAELVIRGGPGPRTPCVAGFVAGAVGRHAVVLGPRSGCMCAGAEDLVAIVVVADVGLVLHAAQLAAAGFGAVPPAIAPVVAAALAFVVGIVVVAVVGLVPHAAQLAAVGFGIVPPALAPAVAASVVVAALTFAVGIIVVAVVGIVSHAAQLAARFVVAGFGAVPPILAPVVVAPAAAAVVVAALALAVGIAYGGALGLVVAVLAAIVGIVPRTAALVVFECAAVPPWLALVVAAVPTGDGPAAAIASAVGFAVGHAPHGSSGIVAALVATVVDTVLLAAQLAAGQGDWVRVPGLSLSLDHLIMGRHVTVPTSVVLSSSPFAPAVGLVLSSGICVFGRAVPCPTLQSLRDLVLAQGGGELPLLQQSNCVGRCDRAVLCPCGVLSFSVSSLCGLSLDQGGAQKAMSEREKQDFARGQGGMAMSQSGQTASQSGTASRTGEAKSRSLGQKAMDFLLEKTQIKAEIKITKEVIKGEGGKEEEVDVWEYPEEDIQSLNELYEKHAVLFNFSGRSKELPLNEKRRWVRDRLIAMEDVPGKEPEVSFHRRGRFAVMIVCVDPTYAQYLLSIGSLKCKGAVVTIQPWKPPRPPQAEASRHRQSMLRNHFWVQFDNLSEGMHSFVQRRLEEEFPSNPIIEWLPANPDFLAPNHDARVACLEVKGRGHLGTSCPQGGSGGAGGKRVALRQSMLQECKSKPGVWYINSSQYRGWIFDDNLDNPRWVWVLKKEPTVKPDIYPPYDSRWRHTGAKRTEDKETGFIVKPMLDDVVMQDVEQRLKLMGELHEVGKNAELAFLENAEASAQQQEQARGREEGSKETEEGKGDNMDCDEGGRGGTEGTEGGSTSTKRKVESREENGFREEETDMAGGREVVLTDKDHSEGASQHEEDRSGSQGSQGQETLEDEERVRERERRRGMHNAENMTVEQILEAEDQREGSGDTESEASSKEEEEEEEEEQEDSDVEDWSRERWIKEVEQLEWGRTIEVMEEDRVKGEIEEEEVQDLRRQAAILVVQVNLLKDENRELEDDTVDVQKIAKGQWKEIEAAARLEVKNGTRRRVVLPCRWNARHSDWEVAINQSLQLLTAPMEECSGSDLQRLIGGEVPARAFILREGGEEPVAIGGGDHSLWAAGGELGAEWVARCTAVAVKVEALVWKPNFFEKRETHLQESEEHQKTKYRIEKKLQGVKAAWWAPAASNHSTRVVILQSKRTTAADRIRITEARVDEEKGRWVKVDFELHDEPYTLLSAYSLNGSQQREDLVERLKEILDGTRHLILVGDWNATLDPSLDKLSGGVRSEEEGWTEESLPIHRLMTSLELIDPYRLHYPYERQFTYRKRNRSQHVSASRIDYFLTSSGVMGMLQSVSIGSLPYGLGLDHKPIHLSLTPDKQVIRGRGFYKINNSLLKTQEMGQAVLQVCQEHNPDTHSFPELLMTLSKASAMVARRLAAKRREREEELA